MTAIIRVLGLPGQNRAVAGSECTPDKSASSVGEDVGPPRSRFFYGWRITGGAFLIYFVGGGLFSTSTVFFKAITEDFGWSRGELSGAFSVGFLVAGLSAPFWGRIADRRGPRSSFIPGAFMAGILCILLSRAWGISSFYLLYTLFAFGFAGISLIPIGVLLSNWFVQRRGRAIGIAYTGDSLGMLLLTPVAGLLVTTVGWRGGYAMAGLMVLLVVVPIAFWVKNRPEDLGILPDGASAGAAGSDSDLQDGQVVDFGLSLRDALATPAFRIVALSWFLTQVPISAVFLHQVPLLTDQGLSTETAALVAGTMGGMGILGRICSGFLAERRSTIRLYAVCYLMCAAGIACLWATAILGTVSPVLYVLLFGTGMGAIYALSPLLMGELFGMRALGEIFGLLGLAATLGGALGGAGAGILFDRTGNYGFVVAVSVALCVVGAVLMLFVRSPLDARAGVRVASDRGTAPPRTSPKG